MKSSDFLLIIFVKIRVKLIMDILNTTNYGFNFFDLISFAKYFFTSLILIAIYIGAYITVTPHAEIKLIKENNASAAVAFSGSLIGFALPLGIIISHSSSIMGCIVWGLIALIVQVIVFFLVRIPIPKISDRIENGELASGLWLGAASLTGGIINAACMTY